jgi:hypothetical protein
MVAAWSGVVEKEGVTVQGVGTTNCGGFAPSHSYMWGFHCPQMVSPDGKCWAEPPVGCKNSIRLIFREESESTNGFGPGWHRESRFN